MTTNNAASFVIGSEQLLARDVRGMPHRASMGRITLHNNNMFIISNNIISSSSSSSSSITSRTIAWRCVAQCEHWTCSREPQPGSEEAEKEGGRLIKKTLTVITISSTTVITTTDCYY